MDDIQLSTNRKIFSQEELAMQLASLRSKGGTVAFLNGSFDLLHAGHLHIIEAAKQAADYLIVALNSDASIQQYKSPERPIITLKYRLEMIAALELVDFVTWFEETDPRAILKYLRPDVHVNGAEYTLDCIEADCVKEIGAKLHLVNRVPSLATSAIIEKIQSLCV